MGAEKRRKGMFMTWQVTSGLIKKIFVLFGHGSVTIVENNSFGPRKVCDICQRTIETFKALTKSSVGLSCELDRRV